MEQALISEKAAKGRLTPIELFQTGIGFFKKQVLDDIALTKIRQFRARRTRIDEVEIRLAYPTMLVDRLGLPNVTRSMRYRASANVTDRDINAAETAVNAKVARGEAVPFIAEWQPWQDFLKRSCPDAYRQLEDRIRNDQAQVLELVEGMNSQQQRDAYAQQKASEKTLHSNLASQLTQRFVSSHMPRYS